MGLLAILLVILLTGPPLTAWAGEGSAVQLQNRYRALRDGAQRGPFGVPLSVESEDRDDQVSAEVYGIIEHPFEAVKAVLSSPASWCEFAPLHLNVKACTFQAQSPEALLTLYLGRKNYQTPDKASSQIYQFAVHTGEPGYMSVVLSAPKGLFGTTAHRFQLEAAAVEGRTVVALRSSYVPSVVTRVMTVIYLATVGRNRVGFSREDAGPPESPRYVKGFRGLVERSAMRYYLAFEAFLDFGSAPVTQRFEASINAVYSSMERYPRQLHHMEKEEYLDTKRRERENQLRLQQTLDDAIPHLTGR
ncbi:MAG TPA: hypothetical protein VEU07_08145 [Candidatus Acidoferrum sp.]|nr:hypothetical protein [Candidatus Acidoferrum sp.]